jgi:Ca2+-binding RTX toxin-like protein
MFLPRTFSLVVAVLATTALTAVPADAATAAKVVFQNGRLVVVGTDAGETIVVSRSGAVVRVQIDGKFLTPRPKPRARLTKSIVVRASGGDDTVVVDSSGGRLPGATIKGGEGNDTLRGSTAGDVVRGGPGNDVLRQGGGDDTLSGEQGDDVYQLDADGAEALVRLVESAGGGTDRVDLSATTTVGMEVALDLTTQLLTPTFGLALSSPGQFENLTGGAADDLLRGGPGPNTLLGGPGSDTLVNSPGADVLDGGPGDSRYDIDGDLSGTVSVLEAGGPEVDAITTGPTTTVNPTLDAGTSASQAVSPSLSLKLSSDSAFDLISGGPRDDTLLGNGLQNLLDGSAGDDDLSGGDGLDGLVSGPGDNTLRGGPGNDLYFLDGDQASTEHLVEDTGGGRDSLVFGETTGIGVDVDLSDTGTQAVTSELDIQLNVDSTFEDVDGTTHDDILAGGSADNGLDGGAGKDTYIHHGSGDGIDTIVGGLDAALDEQVLFDTAGSVGAADLTVNAGANEVRDAATGTFGYNSTGLIKGTSFYAFGTTDTAPAGQLITFNGAGGFALGMNVDSLIATYVSSGVTIGGAGGRDRIIDHSPNGNSLVGRDGVDVLVGGDGADTLQGDRGFAPGVSDTYTGGAGGDTFRFGEAFGGGSLETFGAETVTDFGTGADTVDLFTGLSVRSGLGTTSVVIWDGVTDHGTITATNGHLWIAGDFT